MAKKEKKDDERKTFTKSLATGKKMPKLRIATPFIVNREVTNIAKVRKKPKAKK